MNQDGCHITTNNSLIMFQNEANCVCNDLHDHSSIGIKKNRHFSNAFVIKIFVYVLVDRMVFLMIAKNKIFQSLNIRTIVQVTGRHVITTYTLCKISKKNYAVT